MTELQTLHDAWTVPEPPSAMVAAGLAVVQGLGGGRGLAVAEALERAAVAAEARPFTPPRDDQWIYLEDRLTRSDDDGSEPGRGLTRSPDGRSLISRGWRRADGGGSAYVDAAGELHVDTLDPRRKSDRPLEVAIGPLAGHRTLAALPTDPDELLRWAYRQAEDVTGAGLSEHGDVFAIFGGMLRENLLPPELEAAIFRALKRVPGVSVRTVDVLERPALALAQTEGWLREELLLDPRTYRYRGERSTVTEDAFVDPAKAGNADGRARAGSWVLGERVRIAIVDAPGELP